MCLVVLYCTCINVDVYCPPTEENSFFFSIGVVGEMSSGKSTFINSLFGDLLAEATLDRTTMIPTTYTESLKATDNEKVSSYNKEKNQLVKERLQNKEENLNRLKKVYYKQRDISAAKWKDFPTYKVKPSVVIPHKIGENLFNVVDFPGFNDAQYDKQILTMLKKAHDKLDTLIYMLECQECLKKKSSQLYFDDTMKIFKNRLNKGEMRLIILFNKFDTVENRKNDKDFLMSKQEELKDYISSNLGINNKYVSMYNIQANRILIKLIIDSNNYQFIKRNPTILDDIAQFCRDEDYVNKRQIRRIEQLTPQDQLKRYHEAMKDAIESECKAIEDGSDDDDNDDDEDYKLSEIITPRHSFGVAIEQTQKLKDVLRIFRHPCLVSRKILSNLETSSFSFNHDTEKDEQVFDRLGVILQIMANCGQTGDKLTGELKEEWYDLRLKLGNVADKKIKEWINTLKYVHNTIFKFPNQKQEAQEKMKLEKRVRYGLVHMAYGIASGVLDSNKITRYGQLLTTRNLLTTKMINDLKVDLQISQKENNNNMIKSQYINGWMRDYVNTIALACISQMAMDFCNCDKNNCYDYWYKDRSGKNKNNNGYENITNPIMKLVDCIMSYYNDNKPKQCQLISKMILNYKRKLSKSKEYGRAIDLMLFYFDLNEIRQIFDNYMDFNILCCRSIQVNDVTFHHLLTALKQSITLE